MRSVAASMSLQQFVKARLTVLLPTAIGAGMGAFGSGQSQLWEDESSTWWATQLAWVDFVRLVRNVDAVIAPYYLFMRCWVSVFGDSEAALRAPSVIAMAASAGVLASFGAREFGRAIGLRAGLLFALMPLFSRYAQEARPYALSTLFALLSVCAVARLVDRPDSLARGAAFAATLAACGMVQLLSLMVFAAHAVYVVCSGSRRQSLRPFVVASAIAFVCVAPLAIYGLCQKAQVHVLPLPIPTLRRLGVGALGLATLAICVLIAVASRRAKPYVLVWAIFPAFVLVITHPVLHLFRLRYVIFTLPAWALLVALGLDRLAGSARFRTATTAASAAALLLLGWRAQVEMREPTGHTACDYRGSARRLSRAIQPGDAVAFGGTKHRDRHARLALYYNFAHGPGWLDVMSRQTMAQSGAFYVDTCALPEECVHENVQRVWIMACGLEPVPSALYDGVPGLPAEFLRRNFSIADFGTDGQVTLALLTRNAEQKQP